jgi:pimeloyl-[acyl-carrier protein] methyl ester esterase
MHKQSGTRHEKRTLKLILLPGMDGTGLLFADFLTALPQWIEPEVQRYPTDVPLSLPDLIADIRRAIPNSEPFALLAESFSTPIAIQIAADAPPNLKALIICAGFVESPVRGMLRALLSIVAPLFFRLRMPDFVIKRLLLERGSSFSLVQSARTAIASV